MDTMDGKHMKNLINCGTCGYPLTPEERATLVEQDGVMVKPAPVQSAEECSSVERGEPVAYYVNCTNCGEEKKIERGNHHPWCFCGSDSFDWANSRDTEPAAQRQWVGLTDDDFKQMMSDIYSIEIGDGDYYDDILLFRAVEAKLKELNT